MATQTQAAKWRSLLRRLTRPTPYWRQRLDDEQATEPLAEVAKQIGEQIVFLIALALVVLLPTAYLAGIVFAHPGGLPQVIGEELANTCRISGNCDFGYLMAGYAFGIVFTIVAAGFLVIMIRRAFRLFDGPSDTEQSLAALDARIVALRTELVTSGIITVPAEERKEED